MGVQGAPGSSCQHTHLIGCHPGPQRRCKLSHMHERHFFANAAAPLRRLRLIRLTTMQGKITRSEHCTVAHTVRARFFSAPGRPVSRSRAPTLPTPLEWLWGADAFLRAVNRRGLPPVPLERYSRGRRTADEGIGR